MSPGTIATTNLLYDPGPGITLEVTCNTIVGRWGTHNLHDKNTKTLCKIDAQTPTPINFFFSEPILLFGIILINHNLGPGQHPKFQASNTTDFSNPPVDENFTAIQWGKNAYYIKNTGYYYRYYRIVLEATEIVEIGQAFLLGCYTYTFEKNFNKPIKTIYQPGRKQTTTYYGSDISQTIYRKNRKQLKFTHIKPAQHEIIIEAHHGEYFLFDPYGSDWHNARFCKFETLQTDENQGEGHTLYDITMEYTEQP